MNSITLTVRRIISGGQTGVDRGGLDAAIALGLQHGGWCPLGRRAEDGRIPDYYRLDPTESADYAVRTERNVIDSDGTLILCRGALSGGTMLTRDFAARQDKPFHVVDLFEFDDETVESAVAAVARWIVDHQIRVLNVAGPRESQNRGVALAAKTFLLRLFDAS